MLPPSTGNDGWRSRHRGFECNPDGAYEEELMVIRYRVANYQLAEFLSKQKVCGGGFKKPGRRRNSNTKIGQGWESWKNLPET